MKKVVMFLLVCIFLIGCSKDEEIPVSVKEDPIKDVNCEVVLPTSFKIRYTIKDETDKDITMYYLKNENKLIIIDNKKFDDNIKNYEKIVKNEKTAWIHLIQESDYELGYILDEKIYTDNEINNLIYTNLDKVYTGCESLKNNIYQLADTMYESFKLKTYKSEDSGSKYMVELHPEYLLSFLYESDTTKVNVIEFKDNITSINELVLPNAYLFDIKL